MAAHLNHNHGNLLERRASAAVLHNTGCRPAAQITHAGQHACNLVRFSLGFFTAESGDVVKAWCRLLGLPCTSDLDGMEQLRAIVSNAPPALAALPAIAPVAPPAKSVIRPGLSDNALLSLSVLCRCSDHVFIREKIPMVTLANLKRNIALALPLTLSEPAR
jgi:hypothetical protein